MLRLIQTSFLSSKNVYFMSFFKLLTGVLIAIDPRHYFNAVSFIYQVTKANVTLMRKLIINGADKHPGANFVEQKKDGVKK